MARDRWGRTPLHASAMHGLVNMTHLLIWSGAYVELPDYTQRRPLHLAAKHGHLGVIQLLLSEFAEVEAADQDGRRALHYSARSDVFYNQTLFLLEQGNAELSPADKVGFTPLHFAAFE